MHTFSFGELALIFGIVIVLFGGKRIASVGKALGEGISNFKKGLNGTSTDDKQITSATNPQSQTQVVDVEHKEVPKV